MQITSIINGKMGIPIDPVDIKKIVKKHHEQRYANSET